MANKFFTSIKARFFGSPSDTAVDIGVNGDSNARVAIDAGGRITWGSGSAAGDVNLYRDSADVLKSDDTLQVPALFIDGIEVDTTGAVTDYVLKFNGTKFFPSATDGGGPSSLDQLDDVTLTSPESYQVLRYDGSGWINEYPTTVSLVQNAEATTLQVGEVVYLYGGTGNHASVKRADNGSDTTSSKTVGVVAAAIASGAEGPVVTRGYVDGIDLSTGYSAGDVLWLGTSGAFTTTKPSSPDHLVFVGVVVRATSNGIIYVATQNGYELEEIHDVSLSSLTSGDFLKWNGTLWVNDAIDLGTDTTGNYVSDVSGGTGVTITHTPGEGSTPTVAIGQSVGTTDDVTFNSVTGNLIGDVKATNGTTVLDSGTDGTNATFTGDVTGDLTGNADTASALATSRTIELTGDVTGSVSFDGSANVQISTTIGADTVALGTDTTGNYVQSVTAGTGVTVTGGTGEGSTPTVAIGQAVGTSDSVTFSSVSANLTGDVYASNGSSKILESGTDGTDATFTGSVTGNASTASALETARTIELTGEVTGSVSFDGSGNVQISTTIGADTVALGTDTTGNYVSDVTAGTGVTVAHTPGEGSSPTIAIGQAVGTTDAPTFANVSISGTPSQATHAVTKSYVDNIAAGIDWHQAVRLTTVAALPNSPTYNNVASGVGATLTATVFARLSVDGTNATTGDRVLVKNQSTATENGVYVVTEQGNAVDTYWVLTRATDFDSSPTSEIKTGEAVFTTAGATNANQGFVLTSIGSGTDGAHVLNTDSLTFTQFTGTQAFTAGDGLTQSGNALNAVGNSGRIVVNANDIDLATVSSTTSSGTSTTTLVSDITVDSYGRVTNKETSAVDFSTVIEKSAITAKGDLIVGASSGTPAILGAGTDGYVLTANSAVTNGVEWAEVAPGVVSDGGTATIGTRSYIVADGGSA